MNTRGEEERRRGGEEERRGGGRRGGGEVERWRGGDIKFYYLLFVG